MQSGWCFCYVKIKIPESSSKESIIQSKIIPLLGKRKLSEIKPKDVVAWQNEVRKMTDRHGKPLSDNYLKTVHTQLSAIFNHAVRFYGLAGNPAQKAGRMGCEEKKEMLFLDEGGVYEVLRGYDGQGCVLSCLPDPVLVRSS